MSKLYYTDALVAEYMVREFGVKMQGNSTFEQYDPSTRWDIHPDSLDIFKPQVRDIVNYGIEPDEATIIQRDHKPFFMPEVEDE